MQEITTGTGIAALGFWLFVAAVVAAGIWDSIRKRDAQHETLRRIIESGQSIDDQLTDKLLNLTGGKDLARDLKVGALVLLSISPGLIIFGWIMSIFVEPQLLPIMLAVGALVGCIGIGLWAAAHFIKRWHEQEKSEYPEP